MPLVVLKVSQIWGWGSPLMIRLNILSQSNKIAFELVAPSRFHQSCENTIKRRETICVQNLRKKVAAYFFYPENKLPRFSDFYPIAAFLLSSLMIQTVCLFFTPKKSFVEHWSCFKEQALLLRSAIYSNRYFFTFFVILLQACTTRGPRKLLTCPANPKIQCTQLVDWCPC